MYIFVYSVIHIERLCVSVMPIRTNLIKSIFDLHGTTQFPLTPLSASIFLQLDRELFEE